MKRFAQVISILLHPLLIPLYALFFIFNSGSVFSFIPGGAQFYCYAVTVLTILMMPLVSLLVFKKFRLISSYKLNLKQERVYPIIVAILFAFLGFYLLGKVPYTNIVQQLYLVLIIVLSGFSIVTIRWKMSMHMTALGAICGFLLILGLKYFGDVKYFFVALLFLSGCLASSRLYLEKHNPAQIYVGFVFGLIFVVGILY